MEEKRSFLVNQIKKDLYGRPLEEILVDIIQNRYAMRWSK